MSSSERRKVMESDSLYLNGFIALLDQQEQVLRSYLPNQFPAEEDLHAQTIVEEFLQILEKRIVQRKKDALKSFYRAWNDEKTAASKAQKTAKNEKPEKTEKSDKKVKPEKVKKEKDKEKKPETDDE